MLGFDYAPYKNPLLLSLLLSLLSKIILIYNQIDYYPLSDTFELNDITKIIAMYFTCSLNGQCVYITIHFHFLLFICYGWYATYFI